MPDKDGFMGFSLRATQVAMTNRSHIGACTTDMGNDFLRFIEDPGVSE